MLRSKCDEHLPDRERWNERHRAALSRRSGGGGPASVLSLNAALLDAQPRGPALDVACGLGRNALHLAELGFSVDAVDVSDAALDELARWAAPRAPVRTFRADLRDGALPADGYQVIVDTFFLERNLLPRLAAALAPGGLLFFETFVAFDGRPGTGDPYVLERGELQSVFAALEPVSYGVREPEADGYPIARFVARRGPGLDSHPQ